jgi:hypothetical protein
VAPGLFGGWPRNYTTLTRQAGHANKQSLYSLMANVHGPVCPRSGNRMGMFLVVTWSICKLGRKLSVVNMVPEPQKLFLDTLLGRSEEKATNLLIEKWRESWETSIELS